MSMCMDLASESQTSCDGALCRLLRPCANAECLSPDWLTPSDVLDVLLNKKSHGDRAWWFFIGDSDTRGIVLELLQIVAEAVTGSAEAAAARRDLWWPPEAPDGGRICHLDWAYDARLQLRSSRIIPCTSRLKASPSYIAPFVDYNVTDDDREERVALRLTYVMTDYLSGVPKTSHAMASMFAARPARARPDVLYASFGSWWKNKTASDGVEPESAIAGALRDLADAVPRALRFFGTILGMKKRFNSLGTKAGYFDNTVKLQAFQSRQLRLLPSGTWKVFWRESALAFRAGLSGREGLMSSNGHAPHLVNWVDAQRLMMASSAATRVQTTGGRRDDRAGSSCSPPAIRFEPRCAGFETPPVFIGAWTVYCKVGIMNQTT